MQVPLQVRFHNMAASAAIEAKVRERVARLERLSERHHLLSGHGRGAAQAAASQHRRHHRRHWRPRQGDRGQARVPAPRITRRRLPGDRRRLRCRGAPAGRARADATARGQDPRRPDLRARRSPLSRSRATASSRRRAGSMSTSTAIVVEDDAFDDLEVGSEVMYSLADDEGPMGPQASRVRLLRGRHSVR